MVGARKPWTRAFPQGSFMHQHNSPSHRRTSARRGLFNGAALLLFFCSTQLAAAPPRPPAGPPAGPPPGSPPSLSNAPAVGVWRAWLDSPGGELPFGLELRPAAPGPGGTPPSSFQAFLLNPPERIPIARVSFGAGELVLHLDPYASTIRARLGASAQTLDGTWRKQKGADSFVELQFHARFGTARRFVAPAAGGGPRPPSPAPLPPRWRVKFASDPDAAVGLLSEQSPELLTGTFLTSTGDYRYLAGNRDGDRLRLSCFDGAHAFLFDARLLPADPPRTAVRLAGDFYSGDRWHDTWTAEADAKAQLVDPFAQSHFSAQAELGALRFPDVQGRSRSLTEPAFAGKARILEIFGTWCPNCNDATAYLVELDRKYRARGLAIVGLAFEVTGDLAQDSAQVQRFAAFHHAEFPLLIAGLADKDKATLRLPLLDRVRAYPTTIFLHRDGRVRAVHSGFSGPATGAAHAELRRHFEELIEELLTEPEGVVR